MVVSHPFPADGGSSDDRYEVFNLSSTGALTSTGQIFHMGRAGSSNGLIVFTPDGTIGYSPQDDGSLGIFRFGPSGVVVVNPAYRSGFSAQQVAMDPSGARIYVLDFDTEANGGGLYQLNIDCDGTPGVPVRLNGNNASAYAWLHTAPTTMVVSARSLGSSATPRDTHLVDLASWPPAVLTSTAGFPDPDAIAPQVSVTEDDSWVAVPDNGFSVGSRIAILERVGNTLTARQLLTTTNPIGVAFSPFGRNGLVVNSDGADQYRALNYSPVSPTAPYSVATSTLTYAFGRPQLPGPPIVLERGQLRGRVFIAELDAIRQLQFQGDGGISDVSKTPAGGTGSAQILGTIGVPP